VHLTSPILHKFCLSGQDKENGPPELKNIKRGIILIQQEYVVIIKHLSLFSFYKEG